MTNISNPGNAPLPCPSWCRTDHAKTDRFERYIEPVLDLRIHSMDIARIPNQGGNLSGEVIVDVAVTDDLTNGGREGPLVSASGAECMTPDTAMKVALAIVRAAMVATGDPGEPAAGSSFATGEETPRCAGCVAGDHDQCTGSPATGNACRPCCWPAAGESR